MTNLVNYANTGSPLLVFDDPFPLVQYRIWCHWSTTPNEASAGGGGIYGGSPPPEPKQSTGCDFIDAKQIQWGKTASSLMSVIPTRACLLPDEYVFVTLCATPSRSIPILISPRDCKR